MSDIDPTEIALDRRMLRRAAFLAMRGAGDVEPNPLVGCVIGRARGDAVEALGGGHHRRFGEAHAEVEALRACAARGRSARSATMWVTLEPCAHQGKTPACVGAILEAGIARVVVARRDDTTVARGGLEALRRAGVETCVVREPLAEAVSDPFFMGVTGRRPWFIAKWAQTMDGRVGDRSGESKWISNDWSRRRVHRLRARVDAIVTGVGTVIRDDPQLTPRGVRRMRRAPMRVVLDAGVGTPTDGALLRSVNIAPVIVVTTAKGLGAPGARGRAAALERGGARVVELGGDGGEVDLAALARWLHAEGVATAMVEAGPRVLGSFFERGIVDEAHVFVAPCALVDGEAKTATAGREAHSLGSATRMRLVRVKRLGDDALLHYWREREARRAGA